MADALIGKRLGNYQIERVIGRGGMATVYYGWDARLQRGAAIKVVDARQQDIAYAKRLVTEARMMARWRHEHVIQVYHADQQESLYFFAMEYIDGIDLGALIARYHQAGELIPHVDIVRIGRALASALDYAHEQAVIHRDVKPSNALLALDGRIVLTDFGLALDVTQGTMGEVLGTPHYVAPEQARDSATTVPASDLYALGVVLFEILTGNVPFDDPSPMSVALKHMTESPPMPTQVNPALSIPLEAVLLKALSKAPADRYPSGEVMMDAVERALAFGGGMTDERLRTPVADVLAELAMARGTASAHRDVSGQPTTAPIRHARERAVRQRTTTLLAGGAIVVVVLAIIAVVAILLNQNGAGGEPAPDDTHTPTQPADVQTMQAPAVGSVTAQPTQAEPPTELPPSGTQSAIITPALSTLTAEVAAPISNPTEAVSGSHRAVLAYTERGFYLINPGSEAIDPGGLSFEALDSASGQPSSYQFDVKAWTDRYPLVEAGKCDALEIRLTSAFSQRPPECRDFNALLTPEGSSSEVFWLQRDTVAEFRVLWGGQEIARCAAGSGSCEITLP
jgi:hypothetical protein